MEFSIIKEKRTTEAEMKSPSNEDPFKSLTEAEMKSPSNEDPFKSANESSDF